MCAHRNSENGKHINGFSYFLLVKLGWLNATEILASKIAWPAIKSCYYDGFIFITVGILCYNQCRWTKMFSKTIRTWSE